MTTAYATASSRSPATSFGFSKSVSAAAARCVLG
jgi:hypothetical protein